METIAVFKMSSEVIKCPTIGAASFGQAPILPTMCPYGHNIDRRITMEYTKNNAVFKTSKKESSSLFQSSIMSLFCCKGVVRHNIDRHITDNFKKGKWAYFFEIMVLVKSVNQTSQD